VTQHGLTRAQIAAFQFHGQLRFEPLAQSDRCDWLLVNAQEQASLAQAINPSQWRWQSLVRRPADDAEVILLYRRVARLN
jgi:hypothetical protein